MSLTPCRCSGVGLALCRRLLEEDGRIHLCIACRNAAKCEATRDLLLAAHPAARISTVEADLGNLASVLRVARELRRRYRVAVLHPTGPPLSTLLPLTSMLFPVQVSAPGLCLPQRWDHAQPTRELQGALARSLQRVQDVGGCLVPGLRAVWGAGSAIVAKAMPLGPGLKIPPFPSVTRTTSLWDAWPCVGWACQLGGVLGCSRAPRAASDPWFKAHWVQGEGESSPEACSSWCWASSGKCWCVAGEVKFALTHYPYHCFGSTVGFHSCSQLSITVFCEANS